MLVMYQVRGDQGIGGIALWVSLVVVVESDLELDLELEARAKSVAACTDYTPASLHTPGCDYHSLNTT